jgi:hypothetical protein
VHYDVRAKSGVKNNGNGAVTLVNIPTEDLVVIISITSYSIIQKSACLFVPKYFIQPILRVIRVLKRYNN